MAELTFSHPAVTPTELQVEVKPNSIVWSYGLNAQRFPTYGGEVVQILSCFIEDLTVTGNIRRYKQAEDIYSWFIQYMQVATTDNAGASFNPKPVTMRYPERGWKFQITPKKAPGFKYGRDVVAPEWNLTAAVVEKDQNFTDDVMSAATQKFLRGEGVEFFGTVTADIGFNDEDPFRSPDAPDPNAKGKQTVNDSKKGFQDIADWFSNLIPVYLKAGSKIIDADNQVHNASGPASPQSGGNANQPGNK